MRQFVKGLWSKRIVRFACIGVINTLNDLILLNIFVFLFGIKVLFANCMSASISIVISYFLNHAIVFQKQHPLSIRLFMKFVVITGLSIIAVQTVIIYGVEHVVTISRIVVTAHVSIGLANFLQVNGAKAVAVIGGMAWNFVLYQLVVFREPRQKDADGIVKEEGVVPY